MKNKKYDFTARLGYKNRTGFHLSSHKFCFIYNCNAVYIITYEFIKISSWFA